MFKLIFENDIEVEFKKEIKLDILDYLNEVTDSNNNFIESKREISLTFGD